MLTSPRRLIEYPDPVTRSDEPDIPAHLKNIIDAVEADVFYSQGLYADRPAAGTSGRLYWSTDLKRLSYDTGTAWEDLGEPRAASTVAGLNAAYGGAPPDGAMGKIWIAAGETVPLVYEAAIRRWVSVTRWGSVSVGTLTITGGAQVLPQSFAPNTAIPFFRAMFDAGLRPQYWLDGFCGNVGNTGCQTRLWAQISDSSNGDGGLLSEFTHTAAGFGHTAQAFSYYAVGWADLTLSTAPSRTHGHIVLLGSNDCGGTNQSSFTDVNCLVRMTS